MADERRKHSFEPAWQPECRVLILGSLPGEESLRRAEYYAHRRNVFWRIADEWFGIPRELPYHERLAALNRAGVALWDVVGSAYRRGSLDRDLTGTAPNDIGELVGRLPRLLRIGCNGTAAYELLRRSAPELFAETRFEIRRLPSTSPAAAGIRYETKKSAFAALFLEAGLGMAGR